MIGSGETLILLQDPDRSVCNLAREAGFAYLLYMIPFSFVGNGVGGIPSRI